MENGEEEEEEKKKKEEETDANRQTYPDKKTYLV